MSILQEQVMQQITNLSEDNLQFLLELINRFMLPKEKNPSDSPVYVKEKRNLVAAGGLHQYANPLYIEEEKDIWRKAAVAKHAED